MRCIGAEDPPCKRCRNSGLDCVMEKPGKQSNEQGEEWVAYVRVGALLIAQSHSISRIPGLVDAKHLDGSCRYAASRHGFAVCHRF